MPCASHDEYEELVGEPLERSKAESDVDTKPTDGMAEEARKGLEWRKEFKKRWNSCRCRKSKSIN